MRFQSQLEAPQRAGNQRESGVVVQSKDGRTVVVGPDGVTVTGGQGSAGTVQLMDPAPLYAMGFGFLAMLVIIILGLPIVRAITRRMDRAPVAPVLPQSQQEQIKALRESVDRLAVEVERVSEGQRWLTRQLSGSTDTAAGDHG
jgi:hypothetical protein